MLWTEPQRLLNITKLHRSYETVSELDRVRSGPVSSRMTGSRDSPRIPHKMIGHNTTCDSRSRSQLHNPHTQPQQDCCMATQYRCRYPHVRFGNRRSRFF